MALTKIIGEGVGSVDTITADNLTIDTNTLYVDSANNSVGIGTSSPEGKFHIKIDNVGTASTDADDLIIEKTVDTGLSILSTTTGRIFFGDASDNDVGRIMYVHTDNSMRFNTNATEALRIDSSGRLLVGKTSTDFNTEGMVISPTFVNLTRDGNPPLGLNRLNSDGDILQFYKDGGSAVGTIGINSDRFEFANKVDANKSGLSFHDRIAPMKNGSTSDNQIDLGEPSIRFDDIYATNGTIQTSDRNEKQDIAELTDAEQRVAVAAKGLLRKFRWRDSVETKGDEARTHFGIIAQDLQAAFAAEGLDAGDYAMFISSTWPDEETGEERTRMGVRYSELLAFIIGAL